MSVENFQLGDGELNAGKYNMRLVRRAILNGWPIPDEIRQLVVNQMALIVGKSPTEKNQIGAAKVLIAADSVNARREANIVQERSTDLAVATLVMKQAMASPEARRLLADLSGELVAPLVEPITPPKPSSNGALNGSAESHAGD